MAQFSIGPSSYGDLRGITQYVNTARIAQQFLSMKRDFDAMKQAQGSGDRLSPNEGMRSRARQTYLYNNRKALGVVVAMPFTSRHDAVLHGNAIDVGVTMANGNNRALTPDEFAWMHANAEKRGFTWTGVNFGEPWHIEGATRAEFFPPYPGITAENATLTPAKPSPKPEEDDMTPDESRRLKRVEELVEGLHNMINKSVSPRVADILENTETIGSDTTYLKREFDQPSRGVIKRLASLLTRVKNIEAVIAPETVNDKDKA